MSMFDYDHLMSCYKPLTVIEKPWGKQLVIARQPKCHLDICLINAGGFSSAHQHRKKLNRFDVLHGAISIGNYNFDLQNGVAYPTNPILLSVGDDPVHIRATYIHRFIAIEDTVLFEAYTPDAACGLDDIKEDDIVRYDTHGASWDTSRDDQVIPIRGASL